MKTTKKIQTYILIKQLLQGDSQSKLTLLKQ